MCRIIELDIREYTIKLVKTTPEIAIKYITDIREGLPDHKKRFLTILEVEEFLELIEKTKLANISNIQEEINAINEAKNKLVELDIST